MRVVVVLTAACIVACGIDAVGTLSSSASDGGAIDGGGGGGPDGALPGDSSTGADALADVDAQIDAGCDACVPFLVTDQLSAPHGVAVYGSMAYIAENNRGHIRQVPTSGGVNTQLYVTGQAPRVIAANAMGVYWGEQTKVSFLPSGSSTRTNIAISGGCSAVRLDTNRAFYGVGGSTDKVGYADLDLTNENDVATSQDDPPAIAFDATFVYWTSAVGGKIARRRRDGTAAAEDVVTGEVEPDSLVVDGGKVYWTVPGAIRQATIVVSTPWTASNLVPGEGRPRGLAKDGNALYWLDGTNATLRKLALLAGAPTTLATNEPQQSYGFMSGIAFDAAYVYWLSSVNGTLKRVAK